MRKPNCNDTEGKAELMKFKAGLPCSLTSLMSVYDLACLDHTVELLGHYFAIGHDQNFVHGNKITFGYDLPAIFVLLLRGVSESIHYQFSDPIRAGTVCYYEVSARDPETPKKYT